MNKRLLTSPGTPLMLCLAFFWIVMFLNQAERHRYLMSDISGLTAIVCLLVVIHRAWVLR